MVADAFPELERRAIPVMGVDDKAFENERQAISLPYCLIGLREGRGVDRVRLGGSSRIGLIDEFIVEFAFTAEKYKREDKSETPLWKYYDFESVRDRIFNAMIRFGSTHSVSFEYISLDVSTDRNAVYIEFRFRQVYDWCRSEDEPDVESPVIILCAKGKPECQN